MSTRTERNTLNRMSQDRSFRIERRGDSQYGVADGFRPKRLMLRGERTPAGEHLTNQGVHISTDAINRNVHTSGATVNTLSLKRETSYGFAIQTEA